MRDRKATRVFAPPPRAEDYNTIKTTWEAVIRSWVHSTGRPRLSPERLPVTVHFVWYEVDRHRDPDGVRSGGAKLMLDGLVAAGVLPFDTHEAIVGFTDSFKFGRGVGVGVHFTCYDDATEATATVDLGIFPHRLPDLNELLHARELGARRSLKRSLRGRLA